MTPYDPIRQHSTRDVRYNEPSVMCIHGTLCVNTASNTPQEEPPMFNSDSTLKELVNEMFRVHDSAVLTINTMGAGTVTPEEGKPIKFKNWGIDLHNAITNTRPRKMKLTFADGTSKIIEGAVKAEAITE